MIIEIWNTFLFQPLYNVLILIYNNWAGENLGWAIIYLTLLLRLALLPLTIISFASERKNDRMDADIQTMAKQYHHDPVLQKEEVRRLLKQKKVSPWAKVVSLAIQAVVVVLLYEVFLFGLEGNRMLDYLYPWVKYPGNINTSFLGFDIGAVHSVFWAGIVALWLFVENVFEIQKERGFEKRDITFLLLFPGAVFAVLWYLPMMKALFFFTSMVFSFVVGVVYRALVRNPEPK